ncbi:unnamed protein product [Schistosoma margrebowiei]|uniref:Uncharacterized protein n=1 Tax=Schistosoma margrebowiei TaxID=48269 RepID=A0A183LCI6_9TREM|nr:unnamed protein product [Schistosoma margrebowiei]
MVVGGSQQETLDPDSPTVTSLTVKLGDTGSNPSGSISSLEIPGMHPCVCVYVVIAVDGGGGCDGGGGDVLLNSLFNIQYIF